MAAGYQPTLGWATVQRDVRGLSDDAVAHGTDRAHSKVPGGRLLLDAGLEELGHQAGPSGLVGGTNPPKLRRN